MRHPISSLIRGTSAAFLSLTAYAGSYSVTGDKVIHHIEVAWVQNLVNTDQVRSVKLDVDRLTPRGGLLVRGVMYDAGSELVWERVKAQTTNKQPQTEELKRLVRPDRSLPPRDQPDAQQWQPEKDDSHDEALQPAVVVAAAISGTLQVFDLSGLRANKYSSLDEILTTNNYLFR